jgi:hypothetical protein
VSVNQPNDYLYVVIRRDLAGNSSRDITEGGLIGIRGELQMGMGKRYVV